MRQLIENHPLETLPLTDEERENIHRAFHPLWEQIKRLPKVVAGTVENGGIPALTRRVLRKF